MKHRRAISNIVAAIMLLAIVFVVFTILYLYVWRNTSPISSVRRAVRTPIVITGVHYTVGGLIIDVRATTAPTYVSYVYILSYPSRAVIDVITLNPPVYVPLGKTVPIVVNIGTVLSKIKSEYVLIGVGSSLGGAPAVYGVPLPLKEIERQLAKSTEFVLLAGIGEEDSDALSIQLPDMHFVIINPALGTYKFYYISTTVNTSTSGTLTILHTNVLDIESLSTLQQRFDLGPVVVFVDPYRASQTYTVTIIDVYGNTHTFTLNKLVNNPSEVVADYLICWEDTWTPYILQEILNNQVSPVGKLDNWIDEVIRVTIFTNGTVRIVPMEGSGAYLHMFMMGSLTENEIINAVVAYDKATGHCLRGSPYTFIVFVKPHYTTYSSSTTAELWDPTTCTYVTIPPLPVFYRVTG